MSAKKSWDVQRKTQQAPVRSAPSAVRMPAPQVKGKREPLKNKRRKERRVARTIMVLFFVLLTGLLFYVVWRPSLRINVVTATGPQSEGVVSLSNATLVGTYGYVIPKNSIFFYPETSIRKQILSTFPESVAVSISRTSFHSIEVHVVPRSSSFIWCGTTKVDYIDSSQCFNTDAEGLVFKNASEGVDPLISQGSSTLRVYASLAEEVLDGQSPVGMHVKHPESVPKALQFIKTLKQLGVPVEALSLRGDEADAWIGRTRITYVLGHEEEAAQLAASTLPQVSVRDGSVEYVDLRFATKAYVKKFEISK